MKKRELKSMDICERGKEGRINGSEAIGAKIVKRKNNEEKIDDEKKWG